jgi:hypothetical protein
VNVLSEFLDDRAGRKSAEEAADDLWLRERAGIDPDARRESWRRWLRKTLETSLQWPKEDAARERLIGQCASELTVLARQLRGRGWLLEGKALAEHVRAVLEPIGRAQRAGKVRDFWPYFGEAVARYVGAHAEEIQAQARQSGADAGTTSFAAALAGLGIGKARPAGPSLTELVTSRDDEVRQAKAAKLAADKAQLALW